MDQDTWNRLHSPGTRVVFRLVGGRRVATVTTGPVFRYGLDELVPIAQLGEG